MLSACDNISYAFYFFFHIITQFHSLISLKKRMLTSFLHLALVNEAQANVSWILRDADLCFPFSNWGSKQLNAHGENLIPLLETNSRFRTKQMLISKLFVAKNRSNDCYLRINNWKSLKLNLGLKSRSHQGSNLQTVHVLEMNLIPYKQTSYVLVFGDGWKQMHRRGTKKKKWSESSGTGDLE